MISVPKKNYLLCRPRGGLNDTLCQIERCWRYAEKYNRELIIDTTRSGLYTEFSSFFKANKITDGVYFSISEFGFERFEKLTSTFNSFNLNIPGIYDATVMNFVDPSNGAQMSFNFSQGSNDVLLVHEQCGGGIASLGALARLELVDEIRDKVSRLYAGSENSYYALHVRNTDYRTDLNALLMKIKRFLVGENLLVCSDDASVPAQVAIILKYTKVFTIEGYKSEDGEPIHDNRAKYGPEEQRRLSVNSVVEFLMMSLAKDVFYDFVSTKGASTALAPSGYSRLAKALCYKPDLICKLFRNNFMKTVVNPMFYGKNDAFVNNSASYYELLLRRFFDLGDEASLERALIFGAYVFPEIPLSSLENFRKYLKIESKSFALQIFEERMELLRRCERDSKFRKTKADRSVGNKLNVFVLTTPQAEDRQTKIRQELAQFSIALNFVFSEMKDRHEVKVFEGGAEIRDSIIGLNAGHRKVALEILNRGCEVCVVLEDDAILRVDPTFLLGLSGLEEFDLLFLDNRILPRSIPAVFQPNVYYISQVVGGCGAAGYVLTRKGALKLVKLLETAYDAADIQILSAMDTDAYKRIPHWSTVRRAMKIDEPLKVRRLVPFIVDHPIVNFSTITGRVRANYSPGLWLQEP